MSSPKIQLAPELQQLGLKQASSLELRACCICGVVQNANGMEECLSCDGFMCANHHCDEHTCDCATTGQSATGQSCC